MISKTIVSKNLNYFLRERNTQREKLEIESLTQVWEAINLRLIDMQTNIQNKSIDATRKDAVNIANLLTPKSETLPFGDRRKALCHAIAHLITQELNALPKSSFQEYESGKIRTYEFYTQTSSLNSILNASKSDKKSGLGSFTGAKGHWAALLQKGFIVSKRNIDRFGNEVENGTTVVLNVNLEAIFGYSRRVDAAHQMPDATPMPTPNTPEKPLFLEECHGKNGALSYILLEKNTINKQSGVFENSQEICDKQSIEVANFQKQDVVAQSAKQNLVEGTTSPETPPQPPHAAAPPLVCANMEDVKECVEACISQVFNQENFQSEKIRLSENIVMNELPTENIEKMNSLMAENFEAIAEVLEVPADSQEVKKVVKETIEQHANFLKINKLKYSYAPLQFLRPDFRNSLLDLTKRRLQGTEGVFYKKEYQKPKSNITEDIEIQWFINKKGANKSTVIKYQRKLGVEAVVLAIRYCTRKTQRGFNTTNKNSFVGYVFGVLNNIEQGVNNIENLRTQVEQEEILFKAGQKFGERKRKKNADWVKLVRNSCKNVNVQLEKEQFNKLCELAEIAEAKQPRCEDWILKVAKNNDFMQVIEQTVEKEKNKKQNK